MKLTMTEVGKTYATFYTENGHTCAQKRCKCGMKAECNKCLVWDSPEFLQDVYILLWRILNFHHFLKKSYINKKNYPTLTWHELSYIYE